MIEGTTATKARAEPTQSRKDLIQKRLRNAISAPPRVASIPRRPEGKPAPLSFAQQRLWFIDQIEPGSPAYHVATALRLRGHLDHHSLKLALQHVIDRHEILRSRFPTIDGAPAQMVEAENEIDLPILDLIDVSELDREEEARRKLKEASQRPFNLGKGPLIRAEVVVLKAQEHLLLIVMHHIVCDGWSLAVLFRELELAYSALSKSREPHLPELPLQYGDYAWWQQQTIAGQRLEDLLQWWRTKLAEAPAAIDLPTDHERRDQLSLLRGADKSVTISQPVTAQLNRTGRAHSATPFMMLMSALAITLHRWSGQSDLVIGTVVAGRTHQEIENLIGCFMNFLPIRVQFGERDSGLGIIERLKSTVIESYAHQDCPFDKIVEAVNPSRKLNQNPLYNVGLLLQNYPGNVFSADGLTGSMSNVRTDTALLDLRFIAQEIDSELVVYCEYDTGLFQAQTIEFLLESLRAVLQVLSANPSTPLNQFQLAPGLQRQIESAKAGKKSQTIAIAGTFTCEPLAEPLRFWSDKLQIPLNTRFAPYNQVFQQLLNPYSRMSLNTHGLNVVLLRLEDWVRDLPAETLADPAQIEWHLLDNSQQFEMALKNSTAVTHTPLLVCFCPGAVPETKAAINQSLAAAERRLVQSLSSISGVHLLTATELFKLYPVSDYSDPRGDELGHVPYTPEFFAAIGTMIVRKFHSFKRPTRKVIALDCDQTLWSGVCGEDGPADVRIDEPRQILQQRMREQMGAGMLLCLCSKNNPEDVEEVFRIHKMPLARSDFAATRLNWSSKSQNLQSLAEELNLGLDSFIFIDDNPVECAEVEANCPGVIAVQLPEDLSSFDSFLSHLWPLDHSKTTEEDRQRTALYHQNRERQRFQAQSLSFGDFLAGLKLEVRIEEAHREQYPRINQLTERTNQFNFTTRRRTEAEIENLAATDGWNLLAVSVADRFGDYGLVGVVIYRLTPHALDVDTFLLSCRVLGKGVEHRILSQLGEIAQTNQRHWVDVHFIPSAKNKPARQFLEKVVASFRPGSNSSGLFRFPADFAAKISFNPQTEPSTPPVSGRSADPNHTETADFPTTFPACRWIATEARSAGAILRQIEEQAIAEPKQLEAYVAPRNQMERQICALWQELLRLERVGIHDDFFALGGTSLLAVRLFAQLENITGRKLPLVSLFRSPTVEQLAQIASRRNGPSAASALVAIQPKGTKPPLVLIHGAGGGILWGYANLAAGLPPDQPVYAIDPRWTAELAETRVEDMAERYLAELRSLQPKGPYYLGGYCFGGYVAYELARKLHSEGERTALLLLIDSAAPNGSYDRVTWWHPRFLPQFLLNSFFLAQDVLRLKTSERRELVKRKWTVLKRSLVQRSSLSGRNIIDVEEFIDTSNFPEDELKLWQVHLRAGNEYVPQPYSGRVTLLRTRRQPILCSFDPLYGWGTLAQQGVDVRVIPGSHENIFIEPDVSSLASCVQDCLRVAMETQTSRALEKQSP